MKFFKWLKEKLLKKQSNKDKIIILANKLIQELNKQGYSVMVPEVGTGFGHVNIFIHRNGTEKAKIEVEKLGKYHIEGKAFPDLH